MKETRNEIREWWGRVVRVLVVGVLLLSAGVQAAYKPVDISDITGEKRKALGELISELKQMSVITRDCYICEQLGLMFSKDYSQVLRTMDGHPAIVNVEKAYFVGRGGKPIRWSDASHGGDEQWRKCYYATREFKAEAPLVPFKKEVQKVICSTAKYLLRNMTKEHRWMILATMGNLVYDAQGSIGHEQDDWGMEGGITVKVPHKECRGYNFMDPEGREQEIRVLLAAGKGKDGRWRQIAWRCENLVGAKDILALFPEEVEAMRAHYKERVMKAKDEAKAKSNALMVAADEGMSALSKEKRLARVALATGLYYLDHRDAGCTDGHLNPNTTFILPDGTKHRGEEFMGEAPGLLQQVPHDAILEFYRQPIEQMARKIAEARFREMPPMLRDLLRAQLSNKLIKFDGTPAKMKKDHWRYETFDRRWDLQPRWTAEPENTWFIDSKGNRCSFDIFKVYVEKYVHTIGLVCLCARILGKAETVKLIPPGGGAALTPEQQRAWLAEKMGFCFTEDGAPAYQSERTANGNAVYVDAQGKVRKLAEVPGKDSAGWAEATSTACAVGYDKFTAPYKEELKQLAVQTSKHILASMSPELRQSWFAENNEFFFIPNAQISYATGERTLESGIEHPFYHGTGFDYGRSLYYDPSGKIVPATAVGEAWDKRWWLLYYCEFVAGIDAINALFPAEVEPMRAAFQKSPFHKK